MVPLLLVRGSLSNWNSITVSLMKCINFFELINKVVKTMSAIEFKYYTTYFSVMMTALLVNLSLSRPLNPLIFLNVLICSWVISNKIWKYTSITHIDLLLIVSVVLDVICQDATVQAAELGDFFLDRAHAVSLVLNYSKYEMWKDFRQYLCINERSLG